MLLSCAAFASLVLYYNREPPIATTTTTVDQRGGGGRGGGGRDHTNPYPAGGAGRDPRWGAGNGVGVLGAKGATQQAVRERCVVCGVPRCGNLCWLRVLLVLALG